jgi:hypothetical protein
MSEQKSLKFGVMADSFLLKKWQLQAIQNIQNQGNSFELIIIRNQNFTQETTDKTYSKNLRKNLLYRIFQKFFFKVPLLENVNTQKYFESVEKQEVDVFEESTFACRFKDEDIEIIRSKNLDFILRFGFNIIHGDVLEAAKYGIWSFHHDDDEVIRGGPPGFWEIYENHEVNGIVLQQLTDELDKGNIIRKSIVEVIRHSYSTHVNELLKQGLFLLDFAVENLQKYQKLNVLPPSLAKGKIYKFPKNSVVFKFIWKIFKNKIRFHFDELFRHENWNIGISNQSLEDFFDSKKIKPQSWKEEKHSSNFSADPFVIDFPPFKTSILYENFDYKTYKGVINKVEISKDFSFGKDEVFIDKPFHLSFPFVWNSNNKLLVFPESQQNQMLEKLSFDENFKLSSSSEFFKGDIVDPVIFKYQNKFWLFCGFKKFNPNVHLFAFHSDSLNGKFVPHAQNPIKSDVSASRMAGGFIHFQNNIYRPAQVNDLYYGRKIAMMKLNNLTETTYDEQFEFYINPSENSQYNNGIHTISVGEKMIVFDSKNYKFVWVQFLRTLKRKFINK